MEIKKYTEANRIAWNEVTPYHQKANRGKLYDSFGKSGYSCLDPLITAKIKELGIQGKDVAQLACNNGRELISLKNLGGRRCIGFDISDAAIEEARMLAAHAGVECEFVRSDIYEISREFNESFDLIYVSIGALAWMPDLTNFFGIASGLLRDKGILLVYEMHPFLHMLNEDNKNDPLRITESYFRTEPWEDHGSLDYYTNTQYSASVQYNFPHTISGLIMGCVKNGLDISLFEEYPHDISSCWAHLQNLTARAPLSYILAAKKRGK